MINAKNSEMTYVKTGVPQGSILGPLMYTIFINELPNVIIDPTCQNTCHEKSEYLFNQNCQSCGELPCYADDATFVITSNSRVQNQMKLSNNLITLKTFLNDNFLTLNIGKTTLCEVMILQKRTRIEGNPPHLNVTTAAGEPKVIRASNHI